MLHGAQHLSRWQTKKTRWSCFLTLCVHAKYKFKNCNNFFQLTPVSYEGKEKKKVCSLWHMNTYINMGGGSIWRTLYQTQDQVTGDNRCNHRQKQKHKQSIHTTTFFPLLCGRSLGSSGGQLVTSCRSLQISKQICIQLLHVGETIYYYYYYYDFFF